MLIKALMKQYFKNLTQGYVYGFYKERKRRRRGKNRERGRVREKHR